MEILHAAVGCLGVLSIMKLFFSNKFMRRHTHIESLREKHVVITGGSSGIGLAIALRCAAEGAFVTLIARTPSKLASARHHITSTLGCPPDSIQTMVADTGDANAIITTIEEIFERKPIDILVCNAGLGIGGMVGDVKVEDIDIVTKTNLSGCVYPIHASIPLMKQRSLHHPSSIVIMSSLAGLVPLYGVNVYSPTKYALKGLAEVLHLELVPWNIRINLVCPSFTKTNLLEEEFFNGSETICAIGRTLYSYNHGALDSPDEVARRTIDAVKKGEFLIFTNQQGASLGPLTRGLIPSESISTFLIELVLMIPYRLLSLVWFLNAKKVIKKHNSKLV
eukprot:c19475_g1_i1 orf=240-1247(-)